MTYDEVISYITEAVKSKAGSPLTGAASYPISFREALSLFIEELEEDVLICHDGAEIMVE